MLRKYGFVLFLGTLVAISACVIHINDSVQETKQKTFKVGRSAELIVKNSAGKVAVKGWSKDEIDVKYTLVGKGYSEKKAESRLKKIDVDFKEEGNRLTIDVDYPRSVLRGTVCYVKFDIKVPYDCSVKVDTSSADVRVYDIKADLIIDTSSGDVKARKIKGEVMADTSSGDVDLYESEGRLNVETSSGDVKVRSGKYEDIVIETSSGDVVLEKLSVDRVNMSSSSGNHYSRDISLIRYKDDTSSGDIKISGEMEENGAVDIGTTSGDVRLYFQEKINCSVQFSTVSGSMRIGYFSENLVKSKRKLNCVIGEGASNVNVSTTSGDITLKPGR